MTAHQIGDGGRCVLCGGPMLIGDGGNCPRPRFREHRGGLEASLATTVRVNSREDIIKLAAAALRPWSVVVEDVEITPYGGDDARIGWRDVHTVTVKGYGVFGFVETSLRPHANCR